MVFESDLFLLQKLSFPDIRTVFVFDPGKATVPNYKSGFNFISTKDEINNLSNQKNKYLLFNLSRIDTSSFPLNFDKIEGIISFDQSVEAHEDFYAGNLFFVLNENQSFRWLISESHQAVDFLYDLDTFGTLTDMSNLFSSFTSVFNFFRVKFGNIRKISNGSIQIMKREKHFFDQLKNLNYDSFIIKVDSSYENNILAINFYENTKRNFTLKRAINSIGVKKLKNEYETLKELNSQHFRNFKVPKIVQYDKTLLLALKEDLRSTDYYKVHKIIYKRFLKSIKEYYTRYQSEIQIKDILKDEKILEALFEIENRLRQRKLPKGISLVNLGKIYKKIVGFLNSMDVDKRIPVSLGNNNLKPEYIGYSPNMIYLLNWENARLNTPLLFDLFEYNFIHMEEWENPQPHMLVNDIEALKYYEEFESIYNSDNFDFELHLKVFMIIRFVRELKIILSKKICYPEINLKIYLWIQFIEKYESGSTW